MAKERSDYGNPEKRNTKLYISSIFWIATLPMVACNDDKKLSPSESRELVKLFRTVMAAFSKKFNLNACYIAAITPIIKSRILYLFMVDTHHLNRGFHNPEQLSTIPAFYSSPYLSQPDCL